MPAASTVIRPAASGDLDAVAAIFSHYVISSVVTFEVTPPAVDYWRRTRDDLAGRGLPFLVCECGGRVVGFAYAAPWRAKPAYQHTVESTIYLAPDHIGRGLGRQMLRVLQQECALAGAEQMIAVIADSGNPASAALHRACGFADAGRLRKVGRKHGRLIDTLLMQCDIAAESGGVTGGDPDGTIVNLYQQAKSLSRTDHCACPVARRAVASEPAAVLRRDGYLCDTFM
jgi:L-amino acid N-acyltransferase YncA